MNFIKKITFFTILINLTFADNLYKFEGLYKEPDGEKRLFLTTFFLPYNPSVVAFSSDPAVIDKCAKWWPKGNFFLNQSCECDFLLIDIDGTELDLIKNFRDSLKRISVIYTSTHFNKSPHYTALKYYLESAGFSLLSHWYWEGQSGNAIFVRKDLFDAAMRVLNYSSGPNFVFDTCSYNLAQFFHRVENKSNQNCYQQIDFIYMINLDERPEKFASASSGLNSYGIYPYRFSAVNGWKLPNSVFHQVGVKFFSPLQGEKFLGSTYEEADDGVAYISNEIIQGNGKPYFALGMSRGSIGIILSHLSILQDAYDSGYNTIWVMEDDVEPVEDPRQIPELIRKLDGLEGDWDILFTDTDTKDTLGNHVACRALAFRPNFKIAPLSSFLELFYPISSDFSRIGMRYGAYSMIVRRSGMEKILKYYKTYGIYLPYDMDFWLIPDLKMFSVNKDIVSHLAGALTDNHAPGYSK